MVKKLETEKKALKSAKRADEHHEKEVNYSVCLFSPLCVQSDTDWSVETIAELLFPN